MTQERQVELVSPVGIGTYEAWASAPRGRTCGSRTGMPLSRVVEGALPAWELETA
jgi:hypothetical protein